MRLLCDGREVASALLADTPWKKFKGLLGRRWFDGAMFFDNTSSIHTFFMGFSIDVAFCDEAMRVVDVRTVAPFWFAKYDAHSVVEAVAGSFDEWDLHIGSRLEICE
jgi:uncharacterized membrane protein (UPF0127 family)